MTTNKNISKLISFLRDNAEDGFTNSDFLAAKSSIEREKRLEDAKTNAALKAAVNAYIQKKYDVQLPLKAINSICRGLDKGIKTIIAGSPVESASKSDPLSKETKSKDSEPTVSASSLSFDSFSDFVEYLLKNPPVESMRIDK